MSVTKLSDDQLIEHIILLAGEYRQRFNKNLGITSEIGEYKASQLLNLKRVAGNINEGFDAIDPMGKRVQIKSRICHRSQGRTGVFKNYSFDYAILVLLSDDYSVTEIYKAKCEDIRNQIIAQHYKHPSLTISKFKQLANRIYP